MTAALDRQKRQQGQHFPTPKAEGLPVQENLGSAQQPDIEVGRGEFGHDLGTLPVHIVATRRAAGTDKGRASVTNTQAATAIDNRTAFIEGVEAVFNRKDLDYIDTLYTQDVVDHSAHPGLPDGIAGIRLKVGAFITAFPDLHLEYEQILVDGDLVAGRFNLTGTHQGDFGEIAPTGASVNVIGHDMVRMRNGKVAEHWLQLDMLALMQQLGVVA
jgi:predicted ester cyclase